MAASVLFYSSLRSAHRQQASGSRQFSAPSLVHRVQVPPASPGPCNSLLAPQLQHTLRPCQCDLATPPQWQVTLSPNTLNHTCKIFQALFQSTIQPFSGQLPQTPNSTQACLVAGAARRFISNRRENCKKDREGKRVLPGIPSATLALPRTCLSFLASKRKTVR